MITAHFRSKPEVKNSELLVVVVLEPGAFGKLMAGELCVKNVNQFMPNLAQVERDGESVDIKPTSVKLVLAYTPDNDWLDERLKQEQPDNPQEFIEMLHQSLGREPVFRDDDDVMKM